MDRLVYIVWYRGNGYGIFLSEDMAKLFAEFIPKRNEKLFGTNQEGEYKASIEEVGLKWALENAK